MPKVKVEMELSDLLRISVLIDHHRKEAVESADGYEKGDPPQGLWQEWGREAADLNKKLLAAIEAKDTSRR